MIIDHLLRPPHRITPTTDGEHLSVVPLITDQVSALVTYVFLLLV
jgi:hypothetical protein